ncbi:MAG: hypothetical protein ACOY7J_17765 [Pseudomonadota bacterium]
MNLLPLLFRWHRRLGILIALPVLAWTLSGVLHPLMTRLNPQPVQMAAPLVDPLPDVALTPVMALLRAGVDEARTVRLVQINARHYYQISPAQMGAPLYVDVESGALNPEGEMRHARDLALHFSGRSADQVLNLVRVTRFDDDYLWINRLLPVWRVDFNGDDHLSVYVETAPARLAAMVDDTKRFNSALFNFLHKWEGLPQHWAVTVLMVTLLVLASTVALGGLLLYGLLWKKDRLARRTQTTLQVWHRSLGLGISLFALLFAFSGAWHLLHEPTAVARQLEPLPAWPVAALENVSAAELFGADPAAVLVGCNERPCRLVAPRPGMMQEHDHSEHQSSRSQFALTDVQAEEGNKSDLNAAAVAAARNALGQSPDVPAANVATITVFEGEYGFLNKRLPVLKVTFASADHATVYWEPATGAVAAVLRDRDRYEGFSFGFLHKYHWLDAAGKNVRDAVMALAALLVATVTVLGCWMAWRRRGNL